MVGLGPGVGATPPTLCSKWLCLYRVCVGELAAMDWISWGRWCAGQACHVGKLLCYACALHNSNVNAR